MFDNILTTTVVAFVLCFIVAFALGFFVRTFKDKRLRKIKKIKKCFRKDGLVIPKQADIHHYLSDGEVTKEEIATRLNEKFHRLDIKPEQIRLDRPMDRLGIYDVEVILSRTESVIVKVWTVKD